MTAPVEEPLAEGRAALRVGDAAGARDALERARAHAPAGDVLEGLARAAYIELDFTAAIQGWEQAYAAHRRSGDAVGAIRVARTLAPMYGMILGDHAVFGGWIARAQTLLAGAVDSSERGLVALNLGMFEGDRARKERYFHEALAAVVGSEVDDFCVLEEIFCQLFAACEHAHDVTRADQWIRIGDAIAERRRLPAVSAFCHTHYGGVLTAAGRWAEADVALTEAVRLWDLGQRPGSGAVP